MYKSPEKQYIITDLKKRWEEIGKRTKNNEKRHLTFYASLTTPEWEEVLNYMTYYQINVKYDEYDNTLPLYAPPSKEIQEPVGTALTFINENLPLESKQKFASAINWLIRCSIGREDDPYIAIYFGLISSFYNLTSPQNLLLIIENKEHFPRTRSIALSRMSKLSQSWEFNPGEEWWKSIFSDPFWRKSNPCAPNFSIYALELDYWLTKYEPNKFWDLLPRMKKWPNTDTLFFKNAIYCFNVEKEAFITLKRLWKKLSPPTKKGIKKLCTDFGRANTDSDAEYTLFINEEEDRILKSLR